MTQIFLSTLLFIGFSTLVSSSCDFSNAICNSAGFSCPSGGSIQIKNETYGLTYLDVISFDQLTLTNGDIQGRVAIRNNFYGSNGISVGDKLTDGLGYSLIVGGDLHFANDGAVYPLNKNFFVGGSVSAPSYLTSADNCSSLGAGSGCLNSAFDSAYNYWTQFSSSLSNQNDNMFVSYQYGYAILACNASASNYFIHISPSDFNQIIGFCTVGCSSNANFIFNIFGGDVSFRGNTLQTSGYVIYNIGGGRINIDTSVYGNIVAPNSDITMNGGTVYGSVIAGNFSNVVQINIVTTCSGSSSGSSSTSTSSSGVVSRQDDFCASLTGTASNSSSGSASSTGSGSNTSSGSNSASGSASSTGSAPSQSSSSTSSQSSASGSASPIEGSSTAAGNTGNITSGALSLVLHISLTVVAIVILV